MTRRKIEFAWWGGRGSEVAMPAYAMADEYETDVQAICRAIHRKSGLHVITCRPDGYNIERDQLTEAHFELTLGDPCPGGGWTPRAERWIGVPVQPGHLPHLL